MINSMCGGSLDKPSTQKTLCQAWWSNIKLWGCFSANGTGRLVKVDGIMNKKVYLGILKENLEQSVQDLQFPEDRWYFQQDNDFKHTAKVVSKRLNGSEIRVLEWPAQNPDLNPIESLWVEFKKRVKARQPSNLD